MASPKPTTVAAYLAGLPADRRKAIAAVRKVVLDNLRPGFVEAFGFGMIVYVVPLSRYPKTYNGQPLMLAALASQKSYMSLYLMSVYGHAETARWFSRAFEEAGKKLDMGKSCVRFGSLDDLPLDVIGQAIARVDLDSYLAHYEASRAGASRSKKKPAATPKRRPAAKPARSKRP